MIPPAVPIDVDKVSANDEILLYDIVQILSNMSTAPITNAQKGVAMVDFTAPSALVRSQGSTFGAPQAIAIPTIRKEGKLNNIFLTINDETIESQSGNFLIYLFSKLPKNPDGSAIVDNQPFLFDYSWIDRFLGFYTLTDDTVFAPNTGATGSEYQLRTPLNTNQEVPVVLVGTPPVLFVLVVSTSTINVAPGFTGKVNVKVIYEF